jgi:hypothetical protein
VKMQRVYVAINKCDRGPRCAQEGGNHQKPQTHPTEQHVEKTRGCARQDRDSNPGGQARVAEFKVIPRACVNNK